MRGQGVSKGLCYAKALVLIDDPIVLTSHKEEPEKEWEKFLNAQRAVYEKTAELREKAKNNFEEEASEIMDAHCSLLEDEELVNAVKELILGGQEAATAVDEAMNVWIKQFEKMKNEYFAQRAVDLKDIKERLIRKILHIDRMEISNLPEETILVGADITPSTTVGADMTKVVGLLMEQGGITSHTVILARTLGIPAIVGAQGASKAIKTGDMIGFDGETGEIYTCLSKEEEIKLTDKIRAEKEKKKRLELLAGIPAKSKDGLPVNLYGNIGMPADVEMVIKKGGQGIGLFRSEFLYLGSRTLPSEEQQFRAYKEVLHAMNGKEVIVRTLDIGGDKDVPALGLKKEENPFLGLRAIRLCQERVKVFHAQLRALIRASEYGNLHIMFPMISSIEELQWAKQQLELCKENLLQHQVVQKIDKIPVGIMVEIPSVAVMADIYAKHCDFFSIGTNDLTQYTLAVDRGNESVIDLYSYYHPSVLRMIKSAIEGAHRQGIPCGMCGEAAGDIKMLPLLFAMGLDEYSMASASLLEVKAVMQQLDKRECVNLLDFVLEQETTKEVEDILNKFISEKERKLC